MTPDVRTPGLSFASVAAEYDKARPSYPAEAAAWLVGSSPATVLELGAGTGKLTEVLVAAGHQVIATDPLPEMLAILRDRVPGARTAVAGAERIPVASRSVDVVVCAQSFHWFNHPVALDEIARVLRPDGVLALVWNTRDEGIPWVRKLGKLIGASAAESSTDLAGPARESALFVDWQETVFRYWQNLRRDELTDLVRSRSYVAVMSDSERNDLLARVGALYDDYGRGPDGMQLPYLTRCYRTTVTDAPPPPVVVTPVHEVYDAEATQAIRRDEVPKAAPSGPSEDPGTLLIDFS